MERIFENGVAEVITTSLVNELKLVEKEMLNLTNRRQLLKAAIEKVKGDRPEGYVETTAPVRQMFSKKFAENESISSKINFILAQKNQPLTSAEVTDQFIVLDPKAGTGKKRAKLLKNISTILSIGNEKTYQRIKLDETKKFAYKLIEATA